MDYKILGSIWYTPPMPSPVIAIVLDIGFVAIASGPDGDKWKCYCGFGLGGDQAIDEQIIASRGVKVPKAVAVAHFPQLDPERFVF